MQPKKRGGWGRAAAAKAKEGGGASDRAYDSGEEDDDYEDEEEEERGGGAPWRRQGGGGDDGVVMAVARKGKTLGYACFDEERSTIYVNEMLGKKLGGGGKEGAGEGDRKRGHKQGESRRRACLCYITTASPPPHTSLLPLLHTVSTDLRETVQALKLHLGPTSFLIDAHLLADEDFCKLLGCAVSEDRPQFHIKVAKVRTPPSLLPSLPPSLPSPHSPSLPPSSQARNWDFRRAIAQLCTCLEVRELVEASRAEEEDREDGLMLQSLIGGGREGGAGGGAGGGGLDPRRNYDRLSSVIDVSGEPLLVKALGALIVHLQNSVYSLEMGGRVPVGRLRRFDLGGFVRLDTNALTSLQIFHEEKHPNVISGKGKAKEGFSLFSLLDQTRSRPGRKVLKEWMLRPLRSVERIQERQVMVELLLLPEAMEVVSNAGRLLRKVGDVSRALLRVRRAGATVIDWLTLANTAQHVLLLQNCLAVLAHLATRHGGEGEGGGGTEGGRERGMAVRVVQGLLERISREAVGRVGEVITSVMDLEITKESKVVAVRTGCDAELDRLRADYDSLEEFLSGEARDVLAEQASRLLSTVSVQFLPQVRFTMSSFDTPFVPFSNHLSLPSSCPALSLSRVKGFTTNTKVSPLPPSLPPSGGISRDCAGQRESSRGERPAFPLRLCRGRESLLQNPTDGRA